MGTHPSMPSKALSDGTLLSEIIASDPKAFLGEKVVNHFGPDLPYLFKVLAIGKALSIQAHPDKELGKKLHAERPEIYKGDLGGLRRTSSDATVAGELMRLSSSFPLQMPTTSPKWP